MSAAQKASLLLEKKKKKKVQKVFLSPPRQILYKTFHHLNPSSAQAWRHVQDDENGVVGKTFRAESAAFSGFYHPEGVVGVAVGEAVLYATWPSENSIVL